jgi:hypothetical protein
MTQTLYAYMNKKIHPGDEMILYLKDQKNSTKKCLGTMNSYSKVPGYTTKIISFSMANNEQKENK